MQNKKRYWLKGGIILAIVDVIGSGIGYILFSSSSSLGPQVISNPANSYAFILHDIGNVFFYTFLSPWFIFQFGLMGYENVSILTEILLYGLNVIIYFIIGIFFGWLYGKIKNRNKGI